MSPEITNDPFVQRTGNQCNLRHVNDFNTPNSRIAYHNSESILYLRSKV